MAIKRILGENRESFEMPPNESLTQLREYVLQRNNFQFDGQDSLQVEATAMGKHVAPCLAYAFMAGFEEEYIIPKTIIFWMIL